MAELRSTKASKFPCCAALSSDAQRSASFRSALNSDPQSTSTCSLTLNRPFSLREHALVLRVGIRFTGGLLVCLTFLSHMTSLLFSYELWSLCEFADLSIIFRWAGLI